MPDLGLLLIRLALAGVFINHGWMKIGNMAGTMTFFGGLGLPGWFAYVIAYLEFVGGILVLLGVGTHWIGKLLAADMVGAIALATFPKRGLVGSELEYSLFAMALALVMLGPGKYTVKMFMGGGKPSGQTV